MRARGKRGCLGERLFRCGRYYLALRRLWQVDALAVFLLAATGKQDDGEAQDAHSIPIARP